RGRGRFAPGAGRTPSPGRAGPGRKKSGAGQESTIQCGSLGSMAARMGNASREGGRGCADVVATTTWGQPPPAVQSSEARPVPAENHVAKQEPHSQPKALSPREIRHSHRKRLLAELRS